MYPLSGSSGPYRINLRLISIFGLSLLVVKANLNFSLESNQESIDLDRIDWIHFDTMDFSYSGNVRHIIEAEARLYDNVDSNVNKWSFGSKDPLYNSINGRCLNYFGLELPLIIWKMTCWREWLHQNPLLPSFMRWWWSKILLWFWWNMWFRFFQFIICRFSSC